MGLQNCRQLCFMGLARHYMPTMTIDQAPVCDSYHEKGADAISSCGNVQIIQVTIPNTKSWNPIELKSDGIEMNWLVLYMNRRNFKKKKIIPKLKLIFYVMKILNVLGFFSIISSFFLAIIESLIDFILDKVRLCFQVWTKLGDESKMKKINAHITLKYRRFR